MLAGGIGTWAAHWLSVRHAQLGLQLLAGLFMILLGLYLAGLATGIEPVEQAGGVVWRRIEPLGRTDLPHPNPDPGAGYWSGVGLAAMRTGVQRAGMGHRCWGNGQGRLVAVELRTGNLARIAGDGNGSGNLGGMGASSSSAPGRRGAGDSVWTLPNRAGGADAVKVKGSAVALPHGFTDNPRTASPAGTVMSVFAIYPGTLIQPQRPCRSDRTRRPHV